MSSGVCIVRVTSRKSGEEIDYCFCLDASRRIILDRAEEYATRLSKSSISMCGMGRKGLHVAEVLKVE